RWAPWASVGAPYDMIVGAPGVPTTMQPRPYIVGRGTDDRCYWFFVTDPLAARTTATAAWVGTRAGITGFTVIDLATEEMDTGGGADMQIRSASVVKVPIAMALMAKVNAEHRSLTSAEQSALRLMITESDNNAATRLWNEVGGNNVIGFMRTLGA